jgi:hypothetical protein
LRWKTKGGDLAESHWIGVHRLETRRGAYYLSVRDHVATVGRILAQWRRIPSADHGICPRASLGLVRHEVHRLRSPIGRKWQNYQQDFPRPAALRGPHLRHGTKTPFEAHILRCRVRRKRERLTSNGSIESDAAIYCRVVPQTKCASSLPIEC